MQTSPSPPYIISWSVGLFLIRTIKIDMMILELIKRFILMYITKLVPNYKTKLLIMISVPSFVL